MNYREGKKQYEFIEQPTGIRWLVQAKITRPRGVSLFEQSARLTLKMARANKRKHTPIKWLAEHIYSYSKPAYYKELGKQTE